MIQRPSPTHMLLVAAIAAAATATAMLQPPVIATVRFGPLLEQLDQRAEDLAELEAMKAGIRDEQQRRQAEIDDLRGALENAVDPARREELNAHIALASYRLRFWLDAAAAELDLEQSLRFRNLYRTFKTAVAELADAEGYDMVVLDDRIDEPIPDHAGREKPQVQVLNQIFATKVVFLRDSLDITDDLVTRMNNAHRAAVQGP